MHPGGYPNGGLPLEPGVNQTYIYKKETNETTNNVYGRPLRTVSPPPPLANSTTIYHSDTMNTTRSTRHPPPGGVQVFPFEPSNDTLPPHPGPKQTYMYKKESSNTANTVYGSPHDRYPPVDNGPSYVYPGEPTTAKYLYSSTHTDTTTHGGQPREVITPFPSNGHAPSQVDGGPKHLNELLSNLGDVSICLAIHFLHSAFIVRPTTIIHLTSLSEWPRGRTVHTAKGNQHCIGHQ